MPPMKEGLPRKAFAYAPQPDPATWKLPILKADGTVDEGRLPAAVAAVGEGFRGEQVQVPAEALPAIKSRLRAAYRKWQGSDVQYPDAIREADALEHLLSEIGKRNNATDQARIQKVHDMMCDLGAECGMEPQDEADEGDTETEGEAVAEAKIVTSGDGASVKFQEASYDAHLVTLAEASPMYDEATRTVWITPIKPGWGNSRDNNYYPPNALQEAVSKGVFNNLKMYKDHPRKSDEKDLPERSVKDWFATTREAVWDAVRGVPRVPVVVHEDTDFRRFKDVPEQIAFSVLGSGVGRPGAVDGKKGRVIESIARLRSVDWVTEAGAGGAIAFAESAASEENDMDIADLTPKDLREGNPRLYEHLVGLGKALAGIDADEKTAEKAVAKAAKVEDDSPPDTGEANTKTKESDVEEAPAWAARLIERIEQIEARESAVADETASATRIAEAKAAASDLVKTTLDSTTIPGSVKDIISAKFAEASVGEGMDFSDATSLTAVVLAEAKAALEMLAPFMRESKVTGLGGTVEDEASIGVREAAVSTITARFGMSPAPAKGKLVWTADELASGQSVREQVAAVATEDETITESATSNLSSAGQKALDSISARW
jgi:hypothetical protein